MAPPLATLALIFAILLTVTTIASSVLAIQAYNDNPQYSPYNNSQTKNNNTIFLYSNIGLSGLVALLCVAGITYSSCDY